LKEKLLDEPDETVPVLRQGFGIVLRPKADPAFAHDTPPVKRGRGRMRAHPTPQLRGGSEETSVTP